MSKTLTELYNQNTLAFGYTYNDILVVEEHKVSYNLMQTLGKIFTNMSIQQDGEIKASDLMQTLMGIPSDYTRQQIRIGLGSHYNYNKLVKSIKAGLESEGTITDTEELAIASNNLALHFEAEMIAALFSKYLDKNDDGESSETPR